MGSKKGFQTNYKGPVMGEVAATYWNSPVSRNEFQGVVDEIVPHIKELIAAVHGADGSDPDVPAYPGMMELLAKLDIMLAYILDDLKIKPADINEWQKKKMVEFTAAQKLAEDAIGPNKLKLVS